jgi:hypothetical protein
MMRASISAGVIAAALSFAAPASAQTQTLMTDTQFINASVCIAYAQHRALADDAPNVEALRDLVSDQGRRVTPPAAARAETRKRSIRRADADTPEQVAELRANRDRACSNFVATGLVQAANTPTP